MNSLVSNFIFRILFIVGAIFGAHLLILDYLDFELFENKIALAYLVNTFFAIISYIVLFLLRNSFKNQIGFLFIGGSLIKFALFFLLFYVSYRADGKISKVEFFAFFVPYTFTLIIEVFSLSKWLNKIES